MKTRYKILIGILLLLIAVRIALPTIVKNYLNKTLENIEGYTGHVEDVDIALYRGAYRIDGLVLKSTEQDSDRPFFSSEGIDLSLSWSAIFDGAITGEIILERPELNFVATESEEDTMATGEDVDWTKEIKSLLPISINLFQIKNGRINYIDEFSDPKVDLYLNEMEFKIEDIRNTTDKSNPLPSPYELTATSIGEGKLNASGKANLLRQIPNFDLDFKFEEANLTAINDFSQAYGWFDFEKGNISLFAEMALVDSTLDGYFKPVLDNVEILDWDKEAEEEGFLRKVYEGVVGGATEILENQPKDQSASRVTIKGTVTKTNIGVATAIITLFKNAFIQPLKKELEGRIGVRGSTIVNSGEKKE